MISLLAILEMAHLHRAADLVRKEVESMKSNNPDDNSVSISINVDTDDLDRAIEKASVLVERLKDANSLASELASFRI